MAWLKKNKEIETLREIGKFHAEVLSLLADMVRPGVATKELDVFAEAAIRKQGGVPAFLNYRPAGASRPYPASLCVSINEEIVHGIPSKTRVFKEGDIVSLDLGITQHGLITDAAVTVPCGKISKEAHMLIDATKGALMAGIEAARPGNYTGDIGFAISSYIAPYKYGVIRDLGGHGVGHHVHEEPFVPNFGKKGEGHELVPGMVLALEPMFTLGSPHIRFMDDGYTIISRDYSWSAHFEHTIAITEGDPIILTEH